VGSADRNKLDGHAHTLPILGSPANFQPQPSDGLLLAIGVPRIRRKVAEQLEARGARFLNLIHPSAIVADTAQIGTGSIICPYAIVSDAVRLGRFVLVNYHASLGHDASAGVFAVLSPYSSLGGSACVEEDTFLGLHASVAPGKRLAARSAMSANSTALSDVPEDCLVYGVPGRISPKLEVSAK